MTKKLLEQYSDKRGELEDLKKKISQAHQQNPGEAFPLGMEAHKRLVELAEETNRIEAFAASLPWSKRRLAEAVMKYGTRWDVVRRELHSYKSADALRMEYNRIFEKNN